MTLFSLKGLVILHQGRRGQLKTLLMEHLKGILFQQQAATNHSICQKYIFYENDVIHCGQPCPTLSLCKRH